MAAECALNALLKKVVDNKQDAGTEYLLLFGRILLILI